jgi:hypothetical protein
MATNYELGLLRLIPLKLHLIVDGISGFILLGLALLYAPSAIMMVSLIMIALVEIASSLTTRIVTSDGPGLESPLDFFWRWNTGAMPLAVGSKTVDGRPNYGLHRGLEHDNEQLRRAIDSGKTGDKTAMTDPAAAPLGSDDEAAYLHDEMGLAIARRQPLKPPIIAASPRTNLRTIDNALMVGVDDLAWGNLRRFQRRRHDGRL